MPDYEFQIEEDEIEVDPKTKKLADRTAAMVEAAKKVSKQWQELYQDGLNYVYNNQLSGKERKKGWPAVVVNTIFPAVKQEMAIMAQRKPAIRTRPVKADDTAKAKFWQGSLQHRYEKTLKMRRRCREANLDGKLFGWYIAKVFANHKAYWDEDKKKWAYRPEIRVIHPKMFGMDPNSETLDDAMYVYCERDVPAEWALRQWPEAKAIIDKAVRGEDSTEQLASQIAASVSQADADTEKGRGVSADDKSGRICELIENSRATLSIPEGQDEHDLNDVRGISVTITEVYFRDETETKEKDTEDYTATELQELGALSYDAESDNWVVADPEHEVFKDVKGFKGQYKAGDPLGKADWPLKTVDEYTAPKFPNGRVVFKVNDQILNPKEDDQVWQEKHWPFVIGVNHLLPHVPYGLNAIEMPRGAQDWINVSASHLLNWLCYHGDPLTLVEDDSMSDVKGNKLSNVAGKILHVIKGKIGAVKREPAPPLSPGVMEIFSTMYRSAQDLAGVHDQAIGASSTGNQTATELSILQQSTQVGIGLQMIHMDEWIVEIMDRVAELDRKYLSVGDQIRMAGQDFTGNVDTVMEYKDEYKDIEFDITLKVGVALPYDQQRLKAEAKELKELFPNNVEIDRQVLQAYEVDNAEEVLQAQADYAEFQQWKAAQLEAAQAAEAGQAVGGVPGGIPAPPA